MRAVDEVVDTRPAWARLPDAPSQVTPPDRRPGSLRRTVVMRSLWPEGVTGGIHLAGTARDLWTGPAAARAIAEEHVDVMLTPDKVIAEATGRREDVPWPLFAGLRPGGQLRKLMAQHLPQDVAEATLLHRLVDELGGTSFMATAAWHGWLPDGIEEFEAAVDAPSMLDRPVEGLCISFRPGSPAMTPDGRTNRVSSSHPLAGLPFRADDPLAWHPFDRANGPNLWRIRYTDIWFDGPWLHAAGAFQDSCAMRDNPDRRTLFHEYVFSAIVDPVDFTLADIVVTAGSLPFSTCLDAPATARGLIGRPLAEFGALVPVMLAGAGGCTHLNEVLRNLSDVPALGERLSRLVG